MHEIQSPKTAVNNELLPFHLSNLSGALVWRRQSSLR